MFLQRFITTLILVPLVLWLIFYGNPWLLAGIVMFVFLAMVRECFQLIPLKTLIMQIGFLLLMFLGLWGCDYFFSYWMILGLIVWAFAILAILRFPQSQQYWGYPLIVAVIFLLFLPLFLHSLIHLYYLPEGKE